MFALRTDRGWYPWKYRNDGAYSDKGLFEGFSTYYRINDGASVTRDFGQYVPPKFQSNDGVGGMLPDGYGR